MKACSECGSPRIGIIRVVNPNTDYIYPLDQRNEVLDAYQNTGDPVDTDCYCFDCKRFIVVRTVIHIVGDTMGTNVHLNRPTEMILRNEVDL